MCEMKFLVEDDVRQLFARLCTGLAAALLAAECASWALCPALCLPLLGLFVLLAAGVLGTTGVESAEAGGSGCAGACPAGRGRHCPAGQRP